MKIRRVHAVTQETHQILICEECGGTGEGIGLDAMCAACKGTGRVRHITVSIEAVVPYNWYFSQDAQRS